MLDFSTMSIGRMAVVATAFIGMTNAHMFISEPTPLQGYSPKDPLDASGSNFPCHGAPLPTSGGQKIAAGETFPLRFEMDGGANTAVHGGGSCQLAVLYDTTKGTDPSKWNVIYSIEGGCPSNAKGNLLPGYKACTSPGQSECVHEWDIPMPKGVKSGNAILSWTWFNTVGNREMYQNCVNVELTGGSGDGSFPPLFVANLESINSLKTTENSDVLFPEPGEYVTTMSATDGDNFPKATIGGGDGGASSYAAPTATSAPAYTTSAYTAPAMSSVASDVSSAIASYDDQKGRKTRTTFATFASTTAASAEITAPSSYSSGSSESSSAKSNSTSSDSISCSEDGALICIGSDSFGICDHGAAVPRALSAGTVCKDGVIGGINRFRRHIHGAHKH
jgi:hypothetical protein